MCHLVGMHCHNNFGFARDLHTLDKAHTERTKKVLHSRIESGAL